MTFKSEVRADLKRIMDLQASQNLTLTKHEENLSEHMRRTDILEKRLDSFWTRVLTALQLLSGIAILAKMLIS